MNKTLQMMLRFSLLTGWLGLIPAFIIHNVTGEWMPSLIWGIPIYIGGPLMVVMTVSLYVLIMPHLYERMCANQVTKASFTALILISVAVTVLTPGFFPGLSQLSIYTSVVVTAIFATFMKAHIPYCVLVITFQQGPEVYVITLAAYMALNTAFRRWFWQNLWAWATQANQK